jgi:hypothetical protein
MTTHEKLHDATLALRLCAEKIQTMALNTEPNQAIDWTNLKKIFGQLLRQLIPILLPILLDMLDPQEPPS